MKIGIDSYCYHRFFGEVYDDQKKPGREMKLEDFIARAKKLGVDGVSLESCFFPRHDASFLSEVKGMLDAAGLDRVYAWATRTGSRADATRRLSTTCWHPSLGPRRSGRT